jgi:ubiquinone/menaquinone biosynthesis C-methylase UbiE
MDQSEAMLKSFKHNERLLADIVANIGGCYVANTVTTVNANEHKLKEFSDKNFTLITAIGVFEYLPSPLNSLSEMLRCLDENGLLLLSIPNEKSLFRKIEPALNITLVSIGKLFNINRLKQREYTGFKKSYSFPDLTKEVPNLNRKILKVKNIPLATKGIRKYIYPNQLYIIG